MCLLSSVTKQNYLYYNFYFFLQSENKNLEKITLFSFSDIRVPNIRHFVTGD